MQANDIAKRTSKRHYIPWIIAAVLAVASAVAVGFLAPRYEVTFTDYAPIIATFIAGIVLAVDIFRITALPHKSYCDMATRTVYEILCCTVILTGIVSIFPETDVFSVNAMTTVLQMLACGFGVAVFQCARPVVKIVKIVKNKKSPKN